MGNLGADMTEPKALCCACSSNPYFYHLQNVFIHKPQCLRKFRHWIWMLALLKISKASVGRTWGMIHSVVKFPSSCVSMKTWHVNCFQKRHTIHSIFKREKEGKVKSRESGTNRASSFRPWGSVIWVPGPLILGSNLWGTQSLEA